MVCIAIDFRTGKASIRRTHEQQSRSVRSWTAQNRCLTALFHLSTESHLGSRQNEKEIRFFLLSSTLRNITSGAVLGPKPFGEIYYAISSFSGCPNMAFLALM